MMIFFGANEEKAMVVTTKYDQAPSVIHRPRIRRLQARQAEEPLCGGIFIGHIDYEHVGVEDGLEGVEFHTFLTEDLSA